MPETAPAIESPFLHEMNTRLRACLDRARALTGSLDAKQLNWKPAPEKWSIAQCLEHMRIAADHYLEKLAPAVERAKSSGKPAEDVTNPPKHTLAGRFILKLVEPDAKRTMKTPKQFAPAQSELKPGVVDQFLRTHESVATIIADCDGRDLARIRYGTPEVSFIRINAADGIKVHVTHAERHLTQAERVRAHAEFPS